MLSAITPAGTLPPPVPSESKPTFSSQPSPPPVPNGSKPRARGMQLGAHKSSVPGALPGGLAEARWGGDLMDVNADADDWSTYLYLPTYNHLICPTPADEFESGPPESGSTNAVGLGWAASDDEDPWGAFEDPAPPPVPIPVTELTSPAPTMATPARMHAARPARVAALSPSPSAASPRTIPSASPVPSESTVALSTASSPAQAQAQSRVGMTKEEKAAEMARRKEERKQVRLFHFHFFVCWAYCGSTENCAVKGAEEEYCWRESVAVCRHSINTGN